MKHLLVLLALGATLSSFAQSHAGHAGCPCPPCAPATSIYVWHESIASVKIHCEGTSIFDCYAFYLPTGPVGPGKVEIGMKGVLKLNDADGKPTEEPGQVTYRGMEKDKDGSDVYIFSKD